VRLRTRVKARIQAYLAAENERVPVSDLFSRGGRARLATVTLPSEVRLQVDRLLALEEHLDAQIADQDRVVRQLALPQPRPAAAAQLVLNGERGRRITLSPWRGAREGIGCSSTGWPGTRSIRKRCASVATMS
jgi:hypothetical protein